MTGMRFLGAIALAAVLTGSIAGCSASEPSEPPGIVGTITSVSPGSGETLFTILVEVPEGDVAEPSWVSDKASVRVSDKTRVFDIGGNPVEAREIAVPGFSVSVWFEGPVAESYPVQGSASHIRQMP